MPRSNLVTSRSIPIDYPHTARDVELMAAILGPSIRSRPLGLADRLLGDVGLVGLCRTSVRDLAARPGMDVSRAVRVLASIELGRRATDRALHGPACDRPEAVFELCRDLLDSEREHVVALLLSARHRCLRRVTVSVGSLTASIVHPREVFAPAVRHAAAGVVVVHNHPSGDPSPSAEDLAVTRRLVGAGHVLGIALVDHVIVAREGYVSLRREHLSIGWDGEAETGTPEAPDLRTASGRGVREADRGETR